VRQELQQVLHQQEQEQLQVLERLQVLELA
jgi:hypothetical protein